MDEMSPGLFGSAGLAVPSQNLAHPSLPAVELRETEGLDAGCCGQVQLCPSQTQYKCRLGEVSKELVYSGVLFLQEEVSPVWRIAFKKLFLSDFQSLPAESSKD